LQEADWWSVGIITYEMMTGGRPFEDDNYEYEMESCEEGDLTGSEVESCEEADLKYVLSVNIISL
jgi:serine/threonine protein kinase